VTETTLTHAPHKLSLSCPESLGRCASHLIFALPIIIFDAPTDCATMSRVSARIYVGNLPRDARLYELEDRFSRYGE